MEWGGCLSPRGCPRCPWDSQGRESTVVNHPIQKLNLSTNLKKEFSNYVIFGWHSNHHGFVLTRYIHSAPILVANLFMSPRDKMNSLRPNFFCAQQKCLIHVSRRKCLAVFPAKMRMHSTEFSYHFFVFSSQQPPSRERSCRGAFMWRMPRKVSCLGVSIS